MRRWVLNGVGAGVLGVGIGEAWLLECTSDDGGGVRLIWVMARRGSGF